MAGFTGRVGGAGSWGGHSAGEGLPFGAAATCPVPLSDDGRMACTSNCVGWSINQDGKSERCPVGVLRTVDGVMLEPLADAAGLLLAGAGLGVGGPLRVTARRLPDLSMLRDLAESCHHSFGSALMCCDVTGAGCGGGAAGEGSAT